MFKKNKIAAPFVKRDKAPEIKSDSAIPAEVVAAIAGVVAVICGSAAIKSIRRAGNASRSSARGAWGNASVYENSRAF